MRFTLLLLCKKRKLFFIIIILIIIILTISPRSFHAGKSCREVVSKLSGIPVVGCCVLSFSNISLFFLAIAMHVTFFRSL